MEDLKKLTEWVWATYLGDNEERYQELLQRFDKSATVIGTGKQEIYTSLEAFLAEAGNELREREGIHFHLRDFWCEEQSLGPDHSLVYGGVYVWWESPDHRISTRMDSRFTMVYRRVEGEWRIFHVHQSVPNPEQMEGEAFPKTLTQQMDSARREIDSLSRLADTDSLTGLLNLRGLQQRYEQVDDASYWLMMLDIDNFKQTNDCYGHLAGNQALIDLAAQHLGAGGGQRLPDGRGRVRAAVPRPAPAGCREPGPAADRPGSGLRPGGPPAHRHLGGPDPGRGGGEDGGCPQPGGPRPLSLQGKRQELLYRRLKIQQGPGRIQRPGPCAFAPRQEKKKSPGPEGPELSLEVATRFELVNKGFADLCLTTWPRHQKRE